MFLEGNSRVEDKISKGRRALNATSGLGIRQNGLNIGTCNLIFWVIVLPIITFGCEIWQLTDGDLEKLQAFQRFAGRRIQRFPQRSPSISSYFGLGWLRLETFIYVKKLLFLLTILSMENTHRVNMVFRERVNKYFMNREAGILNKYGSPVYDLMNVCARFVVLDEVVGVIMGAVSIPHKKTWSKRIWSKAWELDDAYWQSTCMLSKDNELLLSTVGKSHYLTWWTVPDRWPYLKRMCETLAKIVCRTSRLREMTIGLRMPHTVKRYVRDAKCLLRRP